MNYTVIYSDRKTVSIRVNRDGSVTVSAPKGMRRAQIDEILSKHMEWIEKKRDNTNKAKTCPDGIYYLGKKYPVCKGKEGTVSFDGSCFFVPDKDNAEVINEAAEILLKKAGREYMARKTEYWAEKMYLPTPPPPKMTSAKTRWGSCGGKGGNRINYSYFLMMTDEYCIDYVTVHELSHIKYKNHGKEFYSLIESYLPDYKDREKRLKEFTKIFTAEGLYV